MRGLLGCSAVFAAALTVSMPAKPSLAWGPEAHRTIALIADKLLQQRDAAAHRKLHELLATDKNGLTKTDIASEAIWADVLRDKSPEARSATASWHVVRLKPDSPDLNAACFGRQPLPAGYPASHGPRNNCVVDKVAQFEKELQNPETSPGERLSAVQFLLNLVADLHDPLNAIDRGDRGGYCLALQVGGAKAPVRLATYWQNTLVGEVVGRDPAAGAARIAAAISPGDREKWAGGAPESWAQETFEVAKSAVYNFGAGGPAGKYRFPEAKGEQESCGEVDLYRVGADYETKGLAAVKQQLAEAGVRLAAVLRDGFK